MKPGRISFFSVILGLVVLSVLSFLAISNWRISQKRSELNLQIEELRKQIQAAEQKNAELSANIGQSQTQDYQEQVAREDLNMKKPGEEVVVVKPQTATTTPAEPAKSFWQKLWEKIF